MKTTSFLALVLALAPAAPLLVGTPTANQPHPKETPSMSKTVKKLTPVLVVKEIEPCLKFWVDQVGFTKTVVVPETGPAGFAMLQHGGVELMLQTRKSVEEDVPAIAQDPFHTALFIEVEDLAPFEKAVQGSPVLMSRRTTFYGATEIAVRDPAGNVVTFAQFENAEK